MTRSVLPIGILVFVALALAMVPSSDAVLYRPYGVEPDPYVTEVSCSTIPSPSSITHEFTKDGRAHYAILGDCQVKKSNGEKRTVKYYVDGNWTPGRKAYATETGRIHNLGDIAPDLFQPGDPNDPSNYTVFVIRLLCEADPWLNDVRCGLEDFAAPNELRQIFPRIYEGPFPLTKGAIPASQRAALLADYKRKTGQFVGPAVSPSVLESAPGFAATRPQPRPPAAPYGATYSPGSVPTLTPGLQTTVQVKVTNTGGYTWTASGPNPFNLSYHWYKANTVSPGTAPAGAVVWDGPRFLVPQDVGFTQSVTFQQVTVQAPSTPGTYVLKWDMAHEGVAWFSAKGVTTFDQTVVVRPVGVTSPGFLQKQPPVQK